VKAESRHQEILEGKRYSLGEAARLTGASPQNARRWFLGYAAPGHRMLPVFGNQERSEPPRLSFLELIELAVVARFRSSAGSPPIPLERLRAAHRFARQELGVEYPFANRKLLVEGGHVLYEFERQHPGTGRLVLDLHGQRVLPGVVLDELQQMDFDDHSGLVLRWFPWGREAPVVLDPEHGGGRPVIRGTNVRAEVIRARFNSGESVQELAEDFDIGVPAVEAALRAA
jgi:uncharacterized protein (DUF433 family)